MNQQGTFVVVTNSAPIVVKAQVDVAGEEVLAAPIVLTGDFASLLAEALDVTGVETLTILVKVDIGAGTDTEFKVLCGVSAADYTYPLVAGQVLSTGGAVTIAGGTATLDVDVDQDVMFVLPLHGVQLIDLQAKRAVAGSEIDSVSWIKRLR